MNWLIQAQFSQEIVGLLEYAKKIETEIDPLSVEQIQISTSAESLDYLENIKVCLQASPAWSIYLKDHFRAIKGQLKANMQTNLKQK